MSRYAETTTVAPDRSRAEIEKTLARYGADSFMYGWDGDRAVLGFVARGLRVKFEMPMPDKNDKAFTRTPTGRTRSTNQAQEAYEQATRQKWRALALVIKAKLEAVEAGIVTFEEEFLAHIMLPGGHTVGEEMIPGVHRIYAGSDEPLSLLPKKV